VILKKGNKNIKFIPMKRAEVFTVVKIHVVFWVVMSCSITVR